MLFKDFYAKAKASFCRQLFSQFIGRGLPIVPKVEFIFKIILFITIFFTKVQEAVLNPG